jgi:hypothetical protein
MNRYEGQLREAGGARREGEDGRFGRGTLRSTKRRVRRGVGEESKFEGGTGIQSESVHFELAFGAPTPRGLGRESCQEQEILAKPRDGFGKYCSSSLTTPLQLESEEGKNGHEKRRRRVFRTRPTMAGVHDRHAFCARSICTSFASREQPCKSSTIILLTQH